MKLTIILSIILSSLQVFSQKEKIQILNLKDNNPIENVQIYSDSVLIDKTDRQGFFKINIKKSNIISIIKEDFYDTIINLKNTNKIFLKKIDAILLNEVVVTNINISNLLDSINDYKKRLRKVNVSNYIHFYNELTINKDTLLYFNNRLHHKNRVGDFCTVENKIIRNFTTNEKLTPVFDYKNKKVLFKDNYLHFSSSYLTTELQIIAKLRDFFNYKVSKDNGYYKIEFTPNKKNNEYHYYGYILIDYEDFGIYELKINTKQQEKDFKVVVFNDEILKYKILKEEIFIKYSKNIDGKYELITYNFDSWLQALNGNFKGYVFKNKCRKEPTLYFDSSKTKKIDLTTYKFTE
jgi:hypothetical protein